MPRFDSRCAGDIQGDSWGTKWASREPSDIGRIGRLGRSGNCWFQHVRVVDAQEDARGHLLAVMPRLGYVKAAPGRSVDDPRVTLEYILDVFTPDGDILDTATGRGHGAFRSTLYSLGSIIAGIATLNTFRHTDLNYEYARAFAVAQAAAFEDLMRNLQASPIFDTYVAVVLESQRRAPPK